MKLGKESINVNLKEILLYSIYFIVIATMLIPESIYVKFFFSVIVFFIVLKNIRFDKIALYLALFSVLYALMGVLNHKFAVLAISYMVSPCSFYLFGKYTVKKFSDEILIWFVLLTILFCGLHVYLGTILDIRSGTLISYSRHIDFPYVERLQATLVGAAISLGLCGFSVFMNYKPLLRLQPLMFLGLSLLSLLVLLHLSNRTGFVIIVLCLIFGMLYMLRNRGAFMFLFVIVLLFLSITYISSNYGASFADFISAYEYRNANSALDTGGERTGRWVDGLENLLASPFGWNPIYDRVHNFWLDVARVGGLLPFIPLVIATFKSISLSIKIYKIKNSLLILIMLELYICFFLTCMVEPILEGLSTYTYLYFMLWGMQFEFYNEYVKKRKLQIINKRRIDNGIVSYVR